MCVNFQITFVAFARTIILYSNMIKAMPEHFLADWSVFRRYTNKISLHLLNILNNRQPGLTWAEYKNYHSNGYHCLIAKLCIYFFSMWVRFFGSSLDVLVYVMMYVNIIELQVMVCKAGQARRVNQGQKAKREKEVIAQVIGLVNVFNVL